jgi:hypothetical protein
MLSGLAGAASSRRSSNTTIHVPGAVTTQAIGIDDDGRVVGDYLDNDGVHHGYLWAKWRFRHHHHRRAGRSRRNGHRDQRPRQAVPLDTNDRGQVAGFVVDALPLPRATEAHGFVLKRGMPGLLWDEVRRS